MSLTQHPPLKSASPEKSGPLRSILNFFLAEINYLRRGLTSWPLFALVLFGLVAFTLAYQIPQDFSFKFGRENPADFLYAASFNQPEYNGQTGFRWSSAESYLRFPGMGNVPEAKLTVTMAVGGRPANLGPAQIDARVGDRKIGSVEVGPGDNLYTFEYKADGRDLEGNLVFALRSPNAFKDSGHQLPLGAVVSQVKISAGPDNGRLVVPALPHLAFLLASLVLIYLALVRSGWSPVWAASISVVPAIGATWAIGFARMHLMPAVEPLLMCLLLVYPLLVLGLRVTGAWLKNDFPVKQMRWLGLAFVAAFVVKAVGMNHPAFITLDHWFRVHQVLRFWDNPADFWQQYYNVVAGKSVTGTETGSAVLGQWGLNFTLPYSPLFYLLAAPLALIFPGHNGNLLAAVNDLAVWLEASQLFLVYLIARRAYGGEWAGRAGIIAAGLLGFYPLSYLLPSDGGYNSILAHWLTLLFVTLLLGALKSPSRWPAIWAGLALGAALLAHTSTLLLVGTLVVVLLIFWLIRPDTRPAGRKLALIAAIGFGLAFVLYYGFYLYGFITQSLPALFDRLGSGGSIGQNETLLGRTLLTGFWPQLWEHFRLLPFLLALGALAALWPYRGKKPGDTTAYALWLAWLAVFLLFSLADLKVNLLQKHMLFAAPLLCLGSGFALSLLREWLVQLQPKASRYIYPVVTGAILLFIAWQGLIVWYGRVYYYLLPPGSG